MQRPLVLRAAALACACLVALAAAPAAEPKAAPADLLFEYAEGLYRDGLYTLAVPEWRKFLKLYPTHPRLSTAHFDLAECLYALKNYKAALPVFERAARDAKLPQHPVALYRIGDCRFRLGDTKGAIEPLTQFLATKLLSPDHRTFVVHARYTLARAHFAHRHLQQALALFNEVLADPSPDNTYKAYVLLPIGDCLAALGKPDDALTRYRDLETYLVAAIKQRKKDDPAAKSQRKLLGDLRTKIAGLLLSQKKYPEALAAFGLLADEGPFAQEIVYGKAQCLFYLQRYQQALVPALAYLKRFPKGQNTLDALYIAGECYYQTGRSPEAERYLGDFLARDTAGKHPAREAAAFGRAAAAYQQGKPHAKAAAAAADFFLTHFPQGSRAPHIHYFRAEAAFWLTHYDPALQHYAKVPVNSPYAQEATYKVAVCLDLLNRHEPAAVAYDAYLARYLDKAKHHQTALERSARLWGQLHRYAKAAERYGQFAERYAKAEPATAEEFLYRKGACEFETKQYDRMFRTFSAYYKLHPDGKHKGDVLYFLAWYHSEEKHDYERAAPLFELCADIPGSYRVRARYLLAHTHNRIGKKRLEQKNKKEADAHFAVAAGIFLDLMTKAPQTLVGPAEYVWTAQVFREQRRFAQAIAAYEALIARYPNEASPTVVYWLGELAAKLEPPDNARAEKYFARFFQSHKEHPYFIWAAFGLAETLKRAGKNTQAWDYYQKVEQLAPQVIQHQAKRDALTLQCRLQMGRMAFDDKRYEYARDHLLRVGYLAAGAAAAEALYKAGKAMWLLHDHEAAIAVWQRLSRNHPKAAWTRQLTEELPKLGLRPGKEPNTLEPMPTPTEESKKPEPTSKPDKEPKTR